MKARKVALYCLAGLMVGCVPIVSLHPLFTKENLVFEEKLLGAWVTDANDSDMSWEFARFEEGFTEGLPKDLQSEFKRLYRLNVTDEQGHKGVLAACLVKLGDRLFLDIFPDQYPSGEADIEKVKLMFNAFLYLHSHTFLRVDAIGDQLKMRLTNEDEFKKLIEAEPKAIEYAETQERYVLTASTKELQAFVTRYADDQRLFPGEITLVRKSK